MRIAIYHNLPSGGAKRALYQMTKLLSQQKHVLDLYTLNASEHTYLLLRSYVRKVVVKDCWLLPWKPDGFPVFTTVRNVLHRIKSLRSIHNVSREIAEQIRQEGYDLAFVTHCRFYQSPNILRYLTIPTVYYCQEPFRKFYEPAFIDEDLYATYDSLHQSSFRRTRWSRFDECIRRTADRYFLKKNDWINVQHAHVILANSYYSRESIFHAYGRFAAVNYLGVDAQQFHPITDIHKEHIVLSVGRFYPGKQHHFIIKSLSRIEQSQRPELVIIGDAVSDTTYQATLNALAEQLQVSLRMLENVSEAELVAWYNRAKVVAYAPLLEPFGLVPLEAMACQTPVVGVREGGIRETIIDGETGFLTDRDEKAFALAISKILHDDARCQTMGKNGRTSVITHWTWEKSVEQLSGYFSQVLEES
jgi:glycosyltransferase involved in cell wall biosynthesis